MTVHVRIGSIDLLVLFIIFIFMSEDGYSRKWFSFTSSAVQDGQQQETRWGVAGCREEGQWVRYCPRVRNKERAQIESVKLSPITHHLPSPTSVLSFPYQIFF